MDKNSLLAKIELIYAVAGTTELCAVGSDTERPSASMQIAQCISENNSF